MIIGELPSLSPGSRPARKLLDQNPSQRNNNNTQLVLLRPPPSPSSLLFWLPTKSSFSSSPSLSLPPLPLPGLFSPTLLWWGACFILVVAFLDPSSASLYFRHTCGFCLLRLLGQTCVQQESLVSERLIPLVALGPHSIQPPLPPYYLSFSL